MQQLMACQMGQSEWYQMSDGPNEVSIPLHAYNHANLLIFFGEQSYL